MTVLSVHGQSTYLEESCLQHYQDSSATSEDVHVAAHLRISRLNRLQPVTFDRIGGKRG